MKAIELSGLHIGRKFNSEVYRTKQNKTERPRPNRDYVIDSIYIHKNGTIVINGGEFHLRPGTELTEI